MHVSESALKEQLKLALKISSELKSAVKVEKKIQDLLKEDNGKLSAGQKESLAAISKSGKPSLASVINVLAGLSSDVTAADAAPTQGQLDVFGQYKKELEGVMNKWKALEKGLR